ncbi:DUF4232 domain-containing protein [Arthrobacter cryoconiti]|uniref:DUF4232 domain-containing protein n=1 Tax=Arthrobacter cryoconiti TaxID=748907 RepID=A0ABV8R0U5_9MICC|nr:DUF4232 domain-containing protein [Arthrobacter cryoconiti]MCC9067693.1 DUF4232 domain-containing protein [Arthrobacter cryoconiti]
MSAHQEHMHTASGQSSRPLSRTAAGISTAAVALGLVLALSGCGASTPKTPTSVDTTASAAATSSAAKTTSAAPSPTPTPAAPAAPALCTAASLAGSIDSSGGGAAGHVYMKLIVKNTSTAACILDGYPGVSMVKAGTDTPLGAPAVRDAQAPSTGPITLTPGQSSAAVLAYTQSGNYQNCMHVSADAIMVYPPSATDKLEIAHPLDACSNVDINLLSIGAFQP